MNCDEKLTYEDLVTFMGSAPVNLFFKDTECRYRFVTDVCNLVNGGEEHSILGKTDLEAQKFSECGREYYEDDKRILATGKGSRSISEVPLETGSEYYEIQKNPVYRDGKIIGIVGIVSNVTARVKMEKELEELSFRDKLTGLYNRNYMESRSKKYVRSGDFPATLIMLDCNYLKRTNDSLGHEYGDLLLQRIAESIRAVTPEGCVAMRVGGDEFLILCPKVSDEMAKALIEQLHRNFEQHSDRILKLDAAIGFYTAWDDTLSFEEAFHLADQDMYRNKRLSRKESGERK